MVTEFKIDERTKIVCKSQNTRQGFRHVAEYYKDGRLIESRSVSYLNRTWESYEYESVIEALLEKMRMPNNEKARILNITKQISLGKIDSQFKTVSMVASLGNIFYDNTQKERVDWKLRMLKAGVGGLNIPEDWDTLSEDEKEKRLDKIIKLMRDKK